MDDKNLQLMENAGYAKAVIIVATAINYGWDS
jgi:hypothetical protein